MGEDPVCEVSKMGVIGACGDPSSQDINPFGLPKYQSHSFGISLNI